MNLHSRVEKKRPTKNGDKVVIGHMGRSCYAVMREDSRKNQRTKITLRLARGNSQDLLGLESGSGKTELLSSVQDDLF
ncbi:unnamed protein product [Caenorhabditis nigoni]